MLESKPFWPAKGSQVSKRRPGIPGGQGTAAGLLKVDSRGNRQASKRSFHRACQPRGNWLLLDLKLIKKKAGKTRLLGLGGKVNWEGEGGDRMGAWLGH